MIKLYIKLNDSEQSFEIAAKRGREILGAARGNYQKDLADKLIQGISDSMVRLRSLQVNLSGSRSVSAQERGAKTVYSERGRKAKGLDKNLTYVKLKKRDKFKICYEESNKSFVSNLIGNSVAGIFNWLEK